MKITCCCCLLQIHLLGSGRLGEILPASCEGRINSLSQSKEVEDVFEDMKGYWNIWMLVVTFFVANVSILVLKDLRMESWRRFALRLPFLGGLFGWLLLDLALKHWLTRLRWKASDHFGNHFSVEQRYPRFSTSIVFMKFHSRISQWWVHFYSCYKLVKWYAWKPLLQGNHSSRYFWSIDFLRGCNFYCKEMVVSWPKFERRRAKLWVTPGFVCMVWLKIYVVVLFLCYAIRYCSYIYIVLVYHDIPCYRRYSHTDTGYYIHTKLYHTIELLYCD